MEVSETLKTAWAAVEEAGLPDKIHETAFKEAVRLLAPVHSVTAATIPAPPPAASATKSGAKGSANSSGNGASNGDDCEITETEETLFTKVEAQTGVQRSKLESITHLDGGVLKISIPGIKLGKNNADKTRTIAQILTIVRGFGLDEAETSLGLIRAEATRLKCYDQANFASQLNKLNGYLITGPTSSRRIRAKAAGIQAFSTLVDSLLGES